MKNTLGVLTILQIILQFSMKNAVDLMWGLFFLMQYISYLRVYKVRLPGLIELVLDELINLIEFRNLSPDFLLGLIDPELSIKSII